MRTILSLATAMVLGGVTVAGAQEAPNSQTLDEQMRRVQSGQTAVPGTWNGGRSSTPAATPLQREWPAEAAAPAPVVTRAPVQYQQYAPASGIDSYGGNAIPALPLEIRTVDDVRYITGGVGDEEMAQLNMVEKDFNFRLLIAGNSGAYISGAMVRIMDEAGRILLSTDGAGPYLYADMKPGTYTVEVTAPQGGIKTGKATVPATGFVKPVMRFTE